VKPASVYKSRPLGRKTGVALSWFQIGASLQHKDASATLRQSDSHALSMPLMAIMR
jgi:hypothetical protein